MSSSFVGGWLLVLSQALVLAVPSDVQRVGGTSGVAVYRRMASPVIDLMAEGEIDAPPLSVLQVLLDFEHASAITHQVSESRVLAASSEELRVYQRLSLPVVSDRDYGLRVTWGARDEVLWLHFDVDNRGVPAPAEAVVRLSTLSGGWELEPVRGGLGTHAIYRVRIDMAGTIPRGLVSGGAARDLPRLFQGVRAQVERGRLTARASTR